MFTAYARGNYYIKNLKMNKCRNLGERRVRETIRVENRKEFLLPYYKLDDLGLGLLVANAKRILTVTGASV